MPTAVGDLLPEILEIMASSGSASSLASNYANMLQSRFDIDRALVLDISNISKQTTQFQDFLINTRKPYIDNKLSSYSAFPELVSYYNEGYKSGIAMPVLIDSRPVLLLMLLSKQEEKFTPELQSVLDPTAQLLGYAYVAKAERDRSLSLAKYFDAAFNSRIPQLLVNGNSTIAKANKEFLMLYEKTQKEIYGKSIGDFFALSKQDIDALKQGSAIEAKAIFGNRLFVLYGNSINENLMHVLAYEVTKLRELEEELKIANEVQHEAFMLLDANTRIIWVSANISKVLQTDVQGLVGKRLTDLSPELDTGKFAQMPYTVVSRLSVGNGNMQEAKMTFYKSLFGYACLVSSSSFDKYVSAVQNYIKNIAEVSSDAMIVIDSLGYITSMNKSAELLLNYRFSDLSSNSVSSLYFDAESQRLLGVSLSAANERGSIGNMFINLRTKSGEALPCEQSVIRLVDENYGTTGYMLVYKELATKRLVEKLQEDVEKIERQASNYKGESDLKTQFIYNISHDLKTPLTNIKGFAKLLYEGSFGELSAEQKEQLSIIISESDRLMLLIQQMLDVAKLSSGKIKLDLQKVNFAELGENPSIKSLAEMAQKKGLAFEWHTDYNVPDTVADPNRVIQVLVNLIGNAIKFTERGSVRVNVFKKGKNVRVEVIDTGIGISKEDKAKLFRKFFQLQHKGLTKQEGSGTGLGLVIAKEIVNLHGGKIGVVSEQGKGSTFWFTIPIYGKKQKESKQ
ncbi:MAG: PAS domain-containing sensor histidine kinase [Candidatus Micrarchaeaceae archaeon]